MTKCRTCGCKVVRDYPPAEAYEQNPQLENQVLLMCGCVTIDSCDKYPEGWVSDDLY